MRNLLRVLPVLFVTAVGAAMIGGGSRTVRAANPPVNACGCYRDATGSCFCGKKAKCDCPGDCEPKGCEERRARELEKEVEAETKRAREAERKERAQEEDRRKKAEAVDDKDEVAARARAEADENQESGGEKAPGSSKSKKGKSGKRAGKDGKDGKAAKDADGAKTESSPSE